MFVIKLHRKSFHFNKRHFATLAEAESGGSRIKTLVDRRNVITRKTDQSLWESVIGLEVHAQINANSKIFRFSLV